GDQTKWRGDSRPNQSGDTSPVSKANQSYAGGDSKDRESEKCQHDGRDDRTKAWEHTGNIGHARRNEEAEQREENSDHGEDAAEDGDHTGGGHGGRTLLGVSHRRVSSIES